MRPGMMHSDTRARACRRERERETTDPFAFRSVRQPFTLATDAIGMARTRMDAHNCAMTVERPRCESHEMPLNPAASLEQQGSNR